MGPIKYIGRFIARLTTTCEPLLRLFRKNTPMLWNEDCQIDFEKIKTYLLNSPVLVTSVPRRPLLMYLEIHDFSMCCVLGQHDETGKKEQAIYYLSKKFSKYKSWYSTIEKTCYALVLAT